MYAKDSLVGNEILDRPELANLPDGDGIYVALLSSQQIATVADQRPPHVVIIIWVVQIVVDLVVLERRARGSPS